MKVLTIKQPWATLIIQGDKRFEFRSWQTKHRGDLLIHAGKEIDKKAMKRLAKYIPENMPTGKILGKVTLVDCVKMSPEFKEMLLKENLSSLSDKEKIELLSSDGMLIKRPILVSDKEIFIGFTEDKKIT